jgi:hypothetical protein
VRPPFPYFGGKTRVGELVWRALGDVRSYAEPFCGSAAVLLARPDWHRGHVETINDRDCYVANFWRAFASDPEAVAAAADWPVNEADLHARHEWLVRSAAAIEWRSRMHSDPEYFDAKVAGWWVWGISQWIGSGWCGAEVGVQKRPYIDRGGRGVHRFTLVQKVPNLASKGAGVHRTKLQKPALYGPSRGVGRLSSTGVRDLLFRISARLRRVRVACGDWSRILTPAALMHRDYSPVGVFLDAPYGRAAGRTPRLYAADDLEVSARARDWALEHGDDPRVRIVLCGYEGEYSMPATWSCIPWSSNGGYESQRREQRDEPNRHRERLWLSPHCQVHAGAAAEQLLLIGGGETAP